MISASLRGTNTKKKKMKNIKKENNFSLLWTLFIFYLVIKIIFMSYKAIDRNNNFGTRNYELNEMPEWFPSHVERVLKESRTICIRQTPEHCFKPNHDKERND